MKIRYLIPVWMIAFLMLCFLRANAQEPATDAFQVQDALTYRLYMEQKWDSLLTEGEKGLKAGYDYYYLHARLGRAYFEKGKYRKAADQMEKALDHNSYDAFAREYAFYSLLYSGRVHAADAHRRKLPSLPRISLPIFVNAEAGPLLSNGNAKQKAAVLPEGKVYSEEKASGNGFYYHAGTGFRVASGIGLYAGFSQISQSYRHFSRIPDSTLFQRSLPYTGHELFLQATLANTGRWSIIPSFKYSRNSLQNAKVDYLPLSGEYRFSSDTTVFHDLLGNLTIQYDLPALNIQLGFTAAELFDSLSTQASIHFTWYPGGNSGLLIRSGLYANRFSGNTHLAAEAMAGMRLSGKIWGQAGLMMGRLENLALNGGFLTYNTGYEIRARAEGALWFSVTPRFQIMVRYQFLTGRYPRYLLSLPDQWETQNIDFQKHNIISGIKWIF